MFKRVFEALKPATLEYTKEVLNFKRPNELSRILTRSDQELGGFSVANMDLTPEKTGRFHGYLNLDPPPNQPDIIYSGYAMFRTKDQEPDIFRRPQFWDWSPYHHIEMRVKGDHRKYIVNIQADTGLISDLYQHRLFLNDPGNWETVVIPINDFVLTNWGVIQEQSEIDREKIKTLGIGLLDKQFGPFNLEIDYIRALTSDKVRNRVINEIQKDKLPDEAPNFGNSKV